MKSPERPLYVLMLVALLALPLSSAQAGIASEIVKAIAKRAGTAKKGIDTARKVKPSRGTGKVAGANKAKRADRSHGALDNAQSFDRSDARDCNKGGSGKRSAKGNC